LLTGRMRLEHPQIAELVLQQIHKIILPDLVEKIKMPRL